MKSIISFVLGLFDKIPSFVTIGCLVVFIVLFGIYKNAYRKQIKETNDALIRLAEEEKEKLAYIDIVTLLQEQRAKDSEILASISYDTENKNALIRLLKDQVKKGEFNDKSISYTSPLPDDITFSLCLAWCEAEGRLPENYLYKASGRTDTPSDDPIASWCRNWRGVTAKDIIEIWTLDLLGDRAGIVVKMNAIRDY